MAGVQVEISEMALTRDDDSFVVRLTDARMAIEIWGDGTYEVWSPKGKVAEGKF